ncbi:hypothetical protein ESCO_000430 [Escovopsis weberi]|uniref:GAR domain-containing protein n=1 Tax=Escovopsis weberi TaxID=150374 RepID=A0A0M9VTB4_ESCWE|nr:hypothetical protein ESCO_000430 [Escovopsis weberi]
MLSPYPADDFFSFLDPAIVVDALASPNGGLRGFLDGASALERDFAMQTAMASQSIADWLNELRNWDWPAEGGSEGFDSINPTRRKLFVKVFSPEDDAKERVGCLFAEEITRYETRVEEISRDLDKLDLESIKSHVMTDHIIPLSRSPNPVVDPKLSFVSSLVASYNKMDDLTAVVTAIVVQTLPNLARLSRLLDTWSTRLTVLQKVNPLLQAISEAETLLQENWNFLSKFPPNIATRTTRYSTRQQFYFTRAIFEPRRDDLAQQVAEPGRMLDFMLDTLAGSLDTLPDEWLTRMEEVEKGYGEWVAACERLISEAELADSRESSRSPADRQMSRRKGRHAAEASMVDSRSGSGILVEPVPLRPANFDQLKRGTDTPDAEISDSTDTDCSPHKRRLTVGYDFDLLGCSPSASPKIVPNHDSTTDDAAARHYQSRPLYRFHDPFARGRAGADAMATVDEVTEDEDEDEDGDDEFDDNQSRLPRSRDRSRDSTTSLASSGVRDVLSDYEEEFDQFRKPRRREPLSFDDDDQEEPSPRSTPPPAANRQARPRRLGDHIFDAIPEDDSDKFGTNDSPYDEDDENFEGTDSQRTRFRRKSVDDSDLQIKISRIIKDINNRTSTDPSSMHLNPPDFRLSTKRKSSRETVPRTNSSFSRRTSVPSFTLTPAQDSLSRGHHHQSIKVYHLSRNNGEAPIKLFVRCVGENGERVMVRVGGGWADLGEYLKEYITHHGRRSSIKDKTNVEVRKLKRDSIGGYSPSGSSPPSRSGSVAGERSPGTPLRVRKTRRSLGGEVPRSFQPRTSSAQSATPQETQPTEPSSRSRSGSQTWVEGDSSFLGLAGPSGRKIEMSEEQQAWVESVKDQVRMTNGDANPQPDRFSELNKVGGTKRMFRKV